MTTEERKDQELQRLECELREFERMTLQKVAKMRRRMEKIKGYGKKN